MTATYTPEEQVIVDRITALCRERDEGYRLDSMEGLTPEQNQRLAKTEEEIEALWPSVPQKLKDEWEA